MPESDSDRETISYYDTKPFWFEKYIVHAQARAARDERSTPAQLGHEIMRGLGQFLVCAGAAHTGLARMPARGQAIDINYEVHGTNGSEI